MIVKKQKQIIKLLAITLSLVIAFSLLPTAVFADTANEIILPPAQQPIGNHTKLQTQDMGNNFVTDFTTDLARFDEDTRQILVKQPSPGATAWEVDNIGTITFKNAGEIGGKNIDVIVSIESVKFGDWKIPSIQINSDEFQIATFRIGSTTDLWFGGYADFSGHEERGWMGSLVTTVSTKVVWSGTADVVDLPFIHLVSDLDKYDPATESYDSIETIDGYANQYYCYSVHEWDYSSIDSGNMKFIANTANYHLSGDYQEIAQGGVYLTTDTGIFKSRIISGQCATEYQIHSQYIQPNGTTNPFKSVYTGAEKTYSVGDTATFDVSYTMGTLFDNTFTPYNSLTIYDEIPEGLTYKSAKLVDKDGNDISSCGNLTYNYGTKTVAFDFNGDWLSDIKNNYKGQDLILRIDTTVNANAPATIKNIGHAVIDGADMPTNEVEIKVVKPVTYNVTHKFESGTQGKALPQAVIDLTPANQTGKLDGEAVAPTDFTPKEVKVSDGKWVFKGWDENSKTINGADVEFVGVWAFVKNTTIITDDPDPAKVTIEAKKTLNGKAPAGNTFTFVLKDENGKVVAAETNYGGSVIFDTMSFNNTGTYIYTLTEKTGGNKNIIYDKTEYTVIVKVTKPDDYYATVSYEKNGKPYKGTPLFVNTTKGTTTDTSGNSESDERPALPETGVNPNLFILLAITAVTSAAVVIKKHKA